jgi:hypothetical protein
MRKTIFIFLLMYGASPTFTLHGMQPTHTSNDKSTSIFSSAFTFGRLLLVTVPVLYSYVKYRDWQRPKNKQLLDAVNKSNRQQARDLIHARADINARDAYGFTPLMIAASKFDTPMVQMLLDAGADKSLRSGNGYYAWRLFNFSKKVGKGYADFNRAHKRLELE